MVVLLEIQGLLGMIAAGLLLLDSTLRRNLFPPDVRRWFLVFLLMAWSGMLLLLGGDALMNGSGTMELLPPAVAVWFPRYPFPLGLVLSIGAMIAVEILLRLFLQARVLEIMFLLRAMPDQQMGIDAALNAGKLTIEQAREKRKELQVLCDFHKECSGEGTTLARALKIGSMFYLAILLLRCAWELVGRQSPSWVDLSMVLPVAMSGFLVCMVPLVVAALSIQVRIWRGSTRKEGLHGF